MKMKGKRVFICSLLAIVAVAIALASGCTAPAPTPEPGEKVFKVANLAAFSGPAAPWGIQMQTSFKIWERDVNAAGGIKVGGESYQVEVVPYDMAGEGATAQTLARKAIYDDGINYLAIMDNDGAVAITDLLEESGSFCFAVGPMAELLSPERPRLFQTYHNVYWFWPEAVDLLRADHPEWTTLATMNPDFIMGRQCGDNWWPNKFGPYAEENGLTLLDPVYYDFGAIDFYSVLTALMAEDVDIIILGSGAVLDQANIIKQARELGFEGQFFATVLEQEYIDIAGTEGAEGMIGEICQPEYLSDVGKHWADEYLKESDVLTAWVALCGYDAPMILKAAIEKADTFDVDKVIAEMGNVTAEGCYGTTSFIENEYSGGLPLLLQMPFHLGTFQGGERVYLTAGQSY